MTLYIAFNPVMAVNKMENAIKKLSKRIRHRSKIATGEEGNVLYCGTNSLVDIGEYNDAKVYCAQASDSSVKVSFTLPNREMVTFSTNFDTKSVDKNSYEKYGGIIYIYEPLTEEIAQSFNNII